MKTLLVPVDFSDCTSSVMASASSIARAFHARVVLLHVAPPEPEFIGYKPGPQSVRDSVAHEWVEEHRALHALELELKQGGIDATALVFQGYPVEKILEEATKIEADLIVMGSHNHGALRNLLVGSVTEGVIKQSGCPILVVPHRG